MSILGKRFFLGPHFKSVSIFLEDMASTKTTLNFTTIYKPLDAEHTFDNVSIKCYFYHITTDNTKFKIKVVFVKQQALVFRKERTLIH